MSIAIQLRSVSKLSGCVVSVGSTRSAAGSCLAIVRVRLPIPSPISKTVVRASLPAPQRLGFPREAMGTETAVRATIGFEEASVRAGMPARTFRTQSVHGLDDHSTKSPCRGSGPRPGCREPAPDHGSPDRRVDHQPHWLMALRCVDRHPAPKRLEALRMCCFCRVNPQCRRLLHGRSSGSGCPSHPRSAKWSCGHPCPHRSASASRARPWERKRPFGRPSGSKRHRCGQGCPHDHSGLRVFTGSMTTQRSRPAADPDPVPDAGSRPRTMEAQTVGLTTSHTG